MEMHPKDLKSVFGLKFNPFISELPLSAIYRSSRVKSLLWDMENLVMDGGFAMISGVTGLGKSSLMRVVENHLSEIPDVVVGELKRPQSNLRDFYPELGALFEVELKSFSRWHSFNSLRERWVNHIKSSLFRPVIIIDEAQQMAPSVLTELRILSSEELDSRKILTVILAGDQRLGENMTCPELLPFYGRIRVRYKLEPLSKDDLSAMLIHVLKHAGNSKLMTSNLIALLAEHSNGNPRCMMLAADMLLSYAAQNNRTHLDESLYFEVFQSRLKKPLPKKGKSNDEYTDEL
jgi:type II secretory pathway predicted ATPase ExeA